MANHRKPVRDEEECRLIDIAETCRSDESAASDALTHPGHSLLYPEYTRLFHFAPIPLWILPMLLIPGSRAGNFSDSSFNIAQFLPLP
jgi:hypothetical protein